MRFSARGRAACTSVAFIVLCSTVLYVKNLLHFRHNARRSSREFVLSKTYEFIMCFHTLPVSVLMI